MSDKSKGQQPGQAAVATPEKPEVKPASAQNDFRKNRRGVMLHKELLGKCYKRAAQLQLDTGERWSQTRVIEKILTDHFKANPVE